MCNTRVPNTSGETIGPSTNGNVMSDNATVGAEDGSSPPKQPNTQDKTRGPPSRLILKLNLGKRPSEVAADGLAPPAKRIKPFEEQSRSIAKRFEVLTRTYWREKAQSAKDLRHEQDVNRCSRMEIEDLNEEIEDLNEEIEDLNEEIEDPDERYDVLEDKYEALRDRNRYLREALTEAKEEAESCQQELAEIKTRSVMDENAKEELGLLRTSKAMVDKEIGELKRKLEDSEKDSSKKEDAAKNSADLLAKANTEIEELKERLQIAEKTASENEACCRKA